MLNIHVVIVMLQKQLEDDVIRLVCLIITTIITILFPFKHLTNYGLR
jgi:hypothetical protein